MRVYTVHLKYFVFRLYKILHNNIFPIFFAVFPLPCQQYFDSGLVPLIISLLSATFDIRKEVSRFRFL